MMNKYNAVMTLFRTMRVQPMMRTMAYTSGKGGGKKTYENNSYGFSGDKKGGGEYKPK